MPTATPSTAIVLELCCRHARSRATRRSSTPQRRKGREVVEDVRPVSVACDRRCDDDASDERSGLELELSTQPRSAKPGEVLAALSHDGIVLTEHRALRTHQWIERDGTRLEPLDADTRAARPRRRTRHERRHRCPN